MSSRKWICSHVNSYAKNWQIIWRLILRKNGYSLCELNISDPLVCWQCYMMFNSGHVLADLFFSWGGRKKSRERNWTALVLLSLSLHKSAMMLLCWWNKSAFCKAILKMGAYQTKNYNFETGLWISTKFGINVADSELCYTFTCQIQPWLLLCVWVRSG